jgi:SET domain-containing protein
MFNHSSSNQNVGWTRDLEREVVVYRALRDIGEGEELCISYGAPRQLTFVDAEAVAVAEAESEEDSQELLGKIEV